MTTVASDKLFIGGRWREPATSQRLTVISPHSEEPIGDAPAAAPEDVDAAVSAARNAFDRGPWPLMDPRERMCKIEELATIYAGHVDEMADLITAEMGSPRSFSRLGQAAGAAAMMHLALAAARKLFPWAERRQGVLGEVHLRRAPVGVVAGIVPWNVPQFVTISKLAPRCHRLHDRSSSPLPETRSTRTSWPSCSKRPASRGCRVGAARRPRSRRAPRAPSAARQGRVHRFHRGGSPHRRICGEQLNGSLELGGKSAAIILDDADLADRGRPEVRAAS